MSDALKKLIEAVEAGVMESPPIGKVFGITPATPLASRAYKGSLDAAKALHDSLLPGVDYSVSPSRAYVLNGYEGIADNPARAWLLAILKAKLQEDQP